MTQNPLDIPAPVAGFFAGAFHQDLDLVSGTLSDIVVAEVQGMPEREQIILTDWLKALLDADLSEEDMSAVLKALPTELWVRGSMRDFFEDIQDAALEGRGL